MTRFKFSIAATDGAARTGAIAMQRGEIRTPAFMPVGTAATVKVVKPEGLPVNLLRRADAVVTYCGRHA